MKMSGDREHAIYAFAKVETWLEDFAKAKDLDLGELRTGVGQLLTNGHPVPVAVEPQRTTVVRKQKHSFWSKLTPKERSVEMKRRILVREGKAEPRRTPRQSKQPIGGVLGGNN